MIKWKPEDEEKMMRLFKDGMNYSQLGVELGRTASAIAIRIGKIVNITKPEESAARIAAKSYIEGTIMNAGPKIKRLWTDEEEKKLLQYLHVGQSYKDISKLMERSQYAIAMRIGKIFGRMTAVKECEIANLLPQYENGTLERPAVIQWDDEELINSFIIGQNTTSLSKKYNQSSLKIYFALKKLAGFTKEKVTADQIREALLKNYNKAPQQKQESASQKLTEQQDNAPKLIKKIKKSSKKNNNEISNKVTPEKQINTTAPKTKNLKKSSKKNNKIMPESKINTKKSFAPKQEFSEPFPQIKQVAEIFNEAAPNDQILDF
jgi:hypothetical protein